MRLIAKFNPHAVPSQRWSWHLKSKNGRTVAASCEGFSSLYKCRYNSDLTLDGLFDHRASNGRIKFSNESAIPAMGKKAKATCGTGQIERGQTVTIGDDKITTYRVSSVKGDFASLTRKGHGFIAKADQLTPVQKPAKNAKGAR